MHRDETDLLIANVWLQRKGVLDSLFYTLHYSFDQSFFSTVASAFHLFYSFYKWLLTSTPWPLHLLPEEMGIVGTPHISSHFLMTPIRSHTPADPWVKVSRECIVAAAIFCPNLNLQPFSGWWVLPPWRRGISDSGEEISDGVMVCCADRISKDGSQHSFPHCALLLLCCKWVSWEVSVGQTISSDQTTLCCCNQHCMTLSI